MVLMVIFLKQKKLFPTRLSSCLRHLEKSSVHFFLQKCCRCFNQTKRNCLLHVRVLKTSKYNIENSKISLKVTMFIKFDWLNYYFKEICSKTDHFHVKVLNWIKKHRSGCNKKYNHRLFVSLCFNFFVVVEKIIKIEIFLFFWCTGDCFFGGKSIVAN